MKENKLPEYYEPSEQSPAKWPAFEALLDCKDCVKSKLRTELSWLRRKSALKPGQESGITTRSCGRCQAELGFIINRGALCPSCKQRVCKDCRKYGPYNKDWVCVICSKQIEIQLATGEWMNAFARRPSRRKERVVSPADGVRNALLRRSWSISSPTTSTWDISEDTRRIPPAKPPRKSLTNENAASTDSEAPSRPSRRYSMSSFDAMSSGRRSLRGDAELCLNKKVLEDKSKNNRNKKPIMDSTRYIQMNEPPRYFFGSTRVIHEPPRPSTLPRRPGRSTRPLSYGDFANDATKFNSIPRRLETRSCSGPRELSSSNIPREPRSISGPRNYSSAHLQEPFSSKLYKETTSVKKSIETSSRAKSPEQERSQYTHRESSSLSESRQSHSLGLQRESRENQDAYYKTAPPDIYSPSKVTPKSYYSCGPIDSHSSSRPLDIGYRNESSWEPRSSSGPREKTTYESRESLSASGSQEPRSISGSRESRSASGSKEPRSASDSREPLLSSESRESRSANGPREPISYEYREPRSASGPGVSRYTSELREPRSLSGPRETHFSKESRDQRLIKGSQESIFSGRSTLKDPHSPKTHEERHYTSSLRNSSFTSKSQDPLPAHIPRELRGTRETCETGSLNELQDSRLTNTLRESRSSAESREWRERSPPRKPLSPLSYISSGPITSTPISSSVPNDVSLPLARQEPTLEKISKYPSALRQSVPTLNEIQRIRDESSSDRLQKKLKEQISLESSCSDSSFLLSPETSDESRNSLLLKTATSRTNLPRSNTSITSGYASMGRLKKTSCAPVRRTKSFQAGQRNPEYVIPARRRISGSHVAKFVHELEKGIKETFSNMNLNKLGGTNAQSRDTLPIKTHVAQTLAQDSGQFYSDTEIDTNKLVNGVNNYKIVFISSGSSKEESEPNSISDSENKNPVGENYGASSSTALPFSKRRYVDASVMTDAKDSSSEVDDSEEDTSSLAPQRSSSPEGDEHNAIDTPKTNRPNFKCFSSESKFVNNKYNNLSPLHPLNQSKLQLMMKQTEAVEAEAQAFQKALMGAFETNAYQGRIDKSTIAYNQENDKQKLFTNDKNLFKQTTKSTNEYENVLVNKTNSKPLYENVEFTSNIIKPIKMCTSVATQTNDDLESWEGEDHYESTSYYSDVSNDSLNEDQNKSVESSTKFTYYNKDSMSMNNNDNNKYAKKQHEYNKRKGEESAFSPSFTYLPDSAIPARSPSPPIHLRLALKKDNSSVSLSSECESVCKSFNVVRGRADHFISPEIEKNVLNRLSEAKVSFLNNSKSVNIKCDIKNKLNSLLNFDKSAHNNEKITLSERNTDLTSGGGNAALSRPKSEEPNLSDAFKIKNTRKLLNMSSQETLEYDPHDIKLARSNVRSNVNAAEEVIPKECSGKTTFSEGEVVCEDLSSGTSEGDDTDDDTHVFKSYDVSKVDKVTLESEGETSKESPSSNSETDEDQHVSKTYDVTKLPSDSESENEGGNLEESREVSGGKENNLHTGVENEKIADKNITESVVDGKYSLSSAFESNVSNPDNKADTSDDKVDKVHCDNSENNVSEIDNFEILESDEKTELPECDQALEDCVRLRSSDSDTHEISPALREDFEISGASAVDVTESAVENKSETESNFGVEGDVLEPLMDLCERSNNENENLENKVKEENVELDETKENDPKEERDETFSVDSLCANDDDDDVSTISSNELDIDNSLIDNEDKDIENVNENDIVNIRNENESEKEIVNKGDKNENISMENKDEDNDKEEATKQLDKDNEDKDTHTDAVGDVSCDNKEESEVEMSHTEADYNDNNDVENNKENLNNEFSQAPDKLKELENEPEICSPNVACENDVIGELSNDCGENEFSDITGSEEVEQGSDVSCSEEAVTCDTLNGEHDQTLGSVVSAKSDIEVKSDTTDNNIDKNIDSGSCDISENENTYLGEKEIVSSSESGHSSGGESDVDIKEPENVLKINVAEKYDDINDPDNKKNERVAVAMVTDKKEFRKGSFQRLSPLSKFSKSLTPPVPLRKAKWSSSSDGLSSSSDVERSDADASDSADTVIENSKVQSKKGEFKKRWEEANRDSDGPSSADSLLQGADSESQCSDGSEEGNLITIVAVGEETILKPSSYGKIYIRSDSTDSDVQIKPTCIVVTGSSGNESSDDSDKKDNSEKDSKGGNDVTILEVTSDHRKDHVMSVRVTSPESSRSASPSRKSTVGELQSMILTTRENQQQFRRSPVEIKESSSLTNYFTVTLGTDSPITHRRINKTPEVRRRKVPERDGADVSSPVASTPTPTFSPTHTPSPTLTPTPDHSEGDLLAYDEFQGNISEETLEKDDVGNDIISDEFPNESETYDSYNEAEINQEGDATFDSIEDGDSLGESNYSETSSEEGFEREEELRGYCKRGYDFTLHTIIEESCEDSDYDKKVQEETAKRDTSELEKYFYFGLGNGPAEPKKYANEESEYSDTFSETSSSIYSEGMESLECEEEIDPAELASSRLEKYFSGFSGFERQPSIRSVGEESEIHTDESGSVGSDSEGSPSPEQPRKRLFRSRGFRSVSSSRSHGYSSDKGDGVISDGSHHSGDGEEEKTLVSGEDEGSTESEETAFDKGDGQFDTIKRRKKKKALAESLEKKVEGEKLESKHFTETKEDDLHKNENSHKQSGETEILSEKYCNEDSKDQMNEKIENDLMDRKYQSRDSGFIGSSDDLLKDKPDDTTTKEIDIKEIFPMELRHKELATNKSENAANSQNDKNSKNASPDNDANNNRSENEERSSNEGKVSRSSTGSSVDLPPYSQSKGCPNLTRKDSFNNWSSDEETNLMMNKMRVFFKNMFSNVGKEFPKGQRVKSPQLVMFEAKLTNLMRSVPGINDEQVKEIVEYLSSEETWSDSYDSSDYTSSDLEGAYARLDQADPEQKSELQEQISASCQQIIKNFDRVREPSDTDSSRSLFGGRANSESSEASSKDTAFVYRRLMSSISHMKPESDRGSIGSGSQSTSPSLFMKIMPFIRDKLVALMYEVEASSENGDDIDSFNGGLPVTSSPRQKLFLPKKHSVGDNISLDSSIDKSSLASSLTSSEDSPTDTEQSPESETGTPKIFRRQKLSIISEKSSTEDFTSIESQRTVFNSHDSPRYHFRHDSKMSNLTPSQRSLEDRANINIAFGRREEERFHRENAGLAKSKNDRRSETRKAKSHMSLEKIHQEDVKQTGERSESLGDLLDRVRSSSEFSSSYEQLDSDSTLKASDSLDRHIGSSSSNIRLNASSRGSLTTSSRGSLATSSRGSLNASSRGSLQGSSGPDEEEERKAKKLSFFRYSRRSSVPDAGKEVPSPEMRSTTLPRSTPAQILTTGTLPRTQSSQTTTSRPTSGLLASLTSTSTTAERSPAYHSGAPRSARYHPPGYRPPPAGLPPKRTYSTPTLRKDRLFPYTDESGTSVDDNTSTSNSTPGVIRSTCTAPPPPSSLSKLGCSSPLGSPLGGSLGRASGSESVGGSLASFENSSDDLEAKRRDSDGGRSPLISLGPKSRSESLASVYSYGEEGRYSKLPVQGEIRVALQYNYKEGQLECSIIQCRDLAPVDAKRIRSDPYVKAYLLPDKSKSGKRKTKVKRHTVNPNFEETFKFVTTLSELESRVLWVSVWHSDMFGRNMFLGEVHIPLSDAIFEDSSPKWHPLLERKEPMETLNYGAVLIVALKFVPPDILSSTGSGSRKSKRSRGALQVRVKEASGLMMGKSNSSPPDPVCKGVLMPERKGKLSKQKTHVLRKTSNPKWNHTMNFDDVTLQELTERSLELSIWNHDRFGSPTFLGGCRLNLGKGHHNNKIVDWLDASGLEQKLWEQMLDRPNLWVESSILLRPNIDSPIYSSAYTD